MSNINIKSTVAYMALDSWIPANVVQLATQNADTPKCGATMVQRVIKCGYKQGGHFQTQTP